MTSGSGSRSKRLIDIFKFVVVSGVEIACRFLYIFLSFKTMRECRVSENDSVNTCCQRAVVNSSSLSCLIQ